MSVSGIGGSSLAMLTQQMQNFKSGKANVQKEELEKLQSQMGGAQNQTTNMFSSLIESFDEVDANDDGLSFDELKDFVHAQGNDGAKEGMKAGGKPPPPSNSESYSSSSFDPLDTNQDGQVSMSEIMANIQQERDTFEDRSSGNEVNMLDIFNKFLDNSEKEGKTNSLFQSQIDQYSGGSSINLESRFSAIDLAKG